MSYIGLAEESELLTPMTDVFFDDAPTATPELAQSRTDPGDEFEPARAALKSTVRVGRR